MPVSTPSPSPIASTSAWNGVASPPSSAAAHTDTAVPSSTSRTSPITPPAPQPTSSAGASASWTPSSVASGAARCAPEANTTREVARRGRRARRAPPRRPRAAPTRGSGSVERPLPMRTPTRPTIPGAPMPRRDPARRAGPAPLVALFGPTGVGKTDVAIALAERLRARGEDPVAVSADALQLYARPGDAHRRGDRGGAGAARAPAARRPAGRRDASAPATTRAARTPRSTRCSPPGRRPIVVGGTGLYLRAALADLDLRPPAGPGVARALRAPSSPRAARAALHAELLDARPGRPRRSRPTDAQRVVRALELLDAGRAEPPGGPSSCGRPRRATRRCWSRS